MLLHEFGHALACRQVGGQADRIMLWPLGGVAFVQPPPRPGAHLWSIAAGPLVNVALVPVTIVAYVLANRAGLRQVNPDFVHFLLSIGFINFGLLVFNMLPVYPLDGRQILQACSRLRHGSGTQPDGLGHHIRLRGGGRSDRTVGLLASKTRGWPSWPPSVAWQAWRGFRIGVLLHGLQPTMNVVNEAQSALRSGRFDDAADLFTRVIEAGGDPGVLAMALTNRGLVEGLRGNLAAGHRRLSRGHPVAAQANHGARQPGVAACHLS